MQKKSCKKSPSKTPALRTSAGQSAPHKPKLTRMSYSYGIIWNHLTHLLRSKIQTSFSALFQCSVFPFFVFLFTCFLLNVSLFHSKIPERLILHRRSRVPPSICFQKYELLLCDFLFLSCFFVSIFHPNIQTRFRDSLA